MLPIPKASFKPTLTSFYAFHCSTQSQATPKGLILFVSLLPSLGEPDVLNPSFSLPDYRDPAPLRLLRPHPIPSSFGSYQEFHNWFVEHVPQESSAGGSTTLPLLAKDIAAWRRELPPSKQEMMIHCAEHHDTQRYYWGYVSRLERFRKTVWRGNCILAEQRTNRTH